MSTLRCDRGGDFRNRIFFANQNSKASIAERVIRTIRGRLYRYFQKERTHRYIDVLPDVVENYNSTPHRSLGGLTPKEVNSDNEADVWAQLYLKRNSQNKSSNLIKKEKKRVKNIKFRFKLNDLVRLSHLKHIFRRGYNQFTGEIFKIAKRFHLQGIPMYKVKDLTRN